MKNTPVSQLIAAGIAARHHMESETIIRAAMATASHKGWKYTLLVWMQRLVQYYQSEGDSASAEQVQRHLDLLQ